MEYAEKAPKCFECKICDFKCNKNSDYLRHLSTRKHKTRINPNSLNAKNAKNAKNEETELYECNCGKIYKHMSTLCNHKKRCKNFSNDNMCDIEDINSLKGLLINFMKTNQELQKQVIELCKNGSNNYNSHNSNSNNKTFNLQVFLNETCKDAMNISEFIENISLQLSDLENMGKLGYVDGVSNIIIKNLNALEVEKRPMHCTDKKREIVYVKDDDEWQKEQEDKKRIKNVIGGVVSKNLQLLTEYENKYPECMNPESKKSDEYNKIIMETICGCKDVIERNKEKVIRKIAKSVTIDKID